MQRRGSAKRGHPLRDIVERFFGSVGSRQVACGNAGDQGDWRSMKNYDSHSRKSTVHAYEMIETGIKLLAELTLATTRRSALLINFLIADALSSQLECGADQMIKGLGTA